MSEGSRRDFFKQLGLLAPGVGIGALFADHLLRGVIQKAIAQNNWQPQYHFAINLYGAPPRWAFDHFLRTNSSENFIHNTSLTNTLVGSGASRAGVYQVVEHRNGLLVPPLWKQQVRVSQGMAPLDSLLEHLIVFRGFGSGIDSHALNNRLQLLPVSSLGSLHGLIAGLSPTQFRAVQMNVANHLNSFRNKKGEDSARVHYGAGVNLIQSLMSPFHVGAQVAKLRELKLGHSDLVSAFRSISQNQLAKYGMAQKEINRMVASADQMMLTGIERFFAEWPALFEKYRQIVNANLHSQSFSGVSDQPLITPTVTDSHHSTHSWQNAVGIFTPEGGRDLREYQVRTSQDQMAAHFALAEFCFRADLCHSVEGMLYDLPMQNSRGALDGDRAITERVSNIAFDQHGTGGTSGAFWNNIFFAALGACTLELVNQMKAQGKFERTHIQFLSDMGRSPRQDATGSDHLWDGMVTSVISGKNKSGLPLVIGNIQSGGLNQSTYSGTMGLAAPTEIALSGQPAVRLTPTHIVSSLATLLEIPSNPWRNLAPSLLEVVNGQVRSLASGRIV